MTANELRPQAIYRDGKRCDQNAAHRCRADRRAGLPSPADMLVDGARSLFFNIGNSAPAARLKDIEDRLQDEVQVLERLVTKAAPNGEQA